jgi:trehalose 6-phosphate phosphatase
VSYLFSPEPQELLAAFARSNVLLAFDFDGTLAPIVDHPRDAVMRPQTKAALRHLTRLYPCVVISGRSREDVRQRLNGTGVHAVVGNHGADLVSSSETQRQIAHWASVLEDNLRNLEGVWVENKGLSLTIHYRTSPDKRVARTRIAKAVGSLTGARITPARKAVNILSPSAPDKGKAMEIQMQQLGCECAVFIGDDETDEDVFTRDWGGELFGISVGARKSAAEYSLRSQLEVDRLLETLVTLRDPAHAIKRA